ncbi:hypothetical protein JOC77_004036, partial [Peribacillus deserti]
TSERHKKSGSKRPFLPFEGDWLMTEEVSSELDAAKSGERSEAQRRRLPKGIRKAAAKGRSCLLKAIGL